MVELVQKKGVHHGVKGEKKFSRIVVILAGSAGISGSRSSAAIDYNADYIGKIMWREEYGRDSPFWSPVKQDAKSEVRFYSQMIL